MAQKRKPNYPKVACDDANNNNKDSKKLKIAQLKGIPQTDYD